MVGLDPDVLRRLRAARRLLEDAREPIGLTEIADRVYLSPFHFHRRYREAFGETPGVTGTRARLELCLGLLRDSRRTVREVCVEAGYSSFSSFTAWFRARTGLSPSGYRKLCRAAQETRRPAPTLDSILKPAMKARLSSITLFVRDQERARLFYVEKLGAEISTDVSTPDGFRWLAVVLPGIETEFVLLTPESLGVAPEVADALRTVQAAGLLGPCVLHVDDCRATHRELAGRGVEFVVEPHEEFYGVEARFVDDSGNAFNVVQPSDLAN